MAHKKRSVVVEVKRMGIGLERAVFTVKTITNFLSHTPGESITKAQVDDLLRSDIEVKFIEGK